jgi:hypothetical protein
MKLELSTSDMPPFTVEAKSFTLKLSREASPDELSMNKLPLELILECRDNEIRVTSIPSRMPTTIPFATL